MGGKENPMGDETVTELLLSHLKIENDIAKIDAEELHYRDLNAILRGLNNNDFKKIEIRNVYGQRYIATSLTETSKSTFMGLLGTISELS